jgi:thymidylate synthase
VFRVFEAQTADDAWRDVATAFSRGEDVSVQASRKGATHEILHAAISVRDPRQRWAVSRNPAMNIAFALAEVIWIMAGRNDSAFLNYYNNGLPKFCGNGPVYHGAYGHRLRKRFNIDQIVRAYESLQKNPESRQVVMQIWDSTVDLPTPDGRPSSEDVPCNVVAMLKVRNQMLEWTQIMRSNDIFRGLPYNFVQFTALQEIIAGWLGLSVGTYNHISDSLHVYEHDLENIKSSLPVTTEANSDSLALTKAEFDLVFPELESAANAVTNAQISAESLADKSIKCVLPEAYRNILCILCAEGVRRRKQEMHIDRIMAHCTNPTYKQLYSRWFSRFHDAS